VAVYSEEQKVSESGIFGKQSHPRIRAHQQPAGEVVPSACCSDDEQRPTGNRRLIGTLMGRYKINISNMSLSRDNKGGHALTVLNLDSVPPTELLDEIHRDPDISNVRVVKLYRFRVVRESREFGGGRPPKEE